MAAGYLRAFRKKNPASAVIAWLDELTGQPLPVMDGLLIATAQCHGLTVVTRNVQDFAPYPQVFNPWNL